MRIWRLLACVCGALISVGLIFATLYGQGVAADFGALWRASHGHPYAPDNFAPFAYPPPALIWIKPLSLLPFWLAFALWSLLSLGLYLWVTPKPLLLISPAAVQCLLFGQTSMLIAALVLRFGGYAIGLALTLKPQLLFMAPLVFLVRRDWRTLTTIAIGAAALILVSLVLFGVQAWVDWFSALSHFEHVVATRDLWWVTITPYGTAMRFGLNPWPFWALGFGVAVFTAFRSKADPLFVSIVASLLASPYAVAHDLVLLLPLIELDLFGALVFSTALAPIGLLGLALKVEQSDDGVRSGLAGHRVPVQRPVREQLP